MPQEPQMSGNKIGPEPDKLLLFICKNETKYKNPKEAQKINQQFRRITKNQRPNMVVEKTNLGAIREEINGLNLSIIRRANERSNKFKSPLVFCSLVIILLICHEHFSSLPEVALAQEAQQQQQQHQKSLPTVIVRGFLNYRTTVDGTVLLFTPDAGQQSSSSSVLPIQATASSTLAATAIHSPSSTATISNSNNIRQPLAANPFDVPTSQSEPPFRATSSENNRSAGQWSVEPTTVLVDTLATLATTTISAQPELASDSPAENLWRPIQATPPLAHNQPTASNPTSSMPSVQTDDLHTDTQPAKIDSAAQSPRFVLGSGRARSRPSLGFTGQSARGRSPWSSPQTTAAAAAAATTTTAASGTNNNSETVTAVSAPQSVGGGNGRGSINGIRRPGLPASSTTVAPSTSGGSSESPAAAANAFQSRLNTANNRLRNRFKHRQPAAWASQTSSNSSTPQTSSGSPSMQPVAESTGLLDVASSVEQPSQSLPAASGPNQAVGGVATEVGASSRDGPSRATEGHSSQPTVADLEVSGGDSQADIQNQHAPGGGPMSRRVGDHPPTGGASSVGDKEDSRLQTGQLQQGSLSSAPMGLDAFFQSDQPAAAEQAASSSSQKATFRAGNQEAEHPTVASSKNEKLNSWLGQHHNKFIPRGPTSERPQNNLLLSSQLPGFNSSSSAGASVVASGGDQAASNHSSVVGDQLHEQTGEGNQMDGSGQAAGTQLQTITRTYSTTLQASKTRLVPLQVKSSTAIFTITEEYLLTKLMTAYQTMPVGEFILPEPTGSPFEVFATASVALEPTSESRAVASPSTGPVVVGPQAADTIQQEQPISLESGNNEGARSANDWLHDFNSAANANDPLDAIRSNQQEASPTLASLLAAAADQRQQQALGNLMASNGLGSMGEQLEQLASSQLDPTQLLADGAIQIPDLNNPLVLAAAIQNPQLAAVILAAQQLQLKQRQNKQRLPSSLNGIAGGPLAPPQQPLAHHQPSYSTSYTTTTRQSTYTMRDTMYTTRLVSFRDGRTVRTRTVSEPGSVIEQTLTTLVTETLPVTIAIKPTAALHQLASSQLATVAPQGQPMSNQATINNALFATQLAQILSRRQQQLQTSFASPPLQQSQQQATPQQLLALQQLINQQQQQQGQRQRTSSGNSGQQQFQPNLQQLLQSMQQSSTNQTQLSPSVGGRLSGGGGGDQSRQLAPSSVATPALPNTVAKMNQVQQQQQQQQQPQQVNSNSNNIQLAAPLSTTLTSLQVRTYTVHNAFKTIYRTITSTVLIPTVLSGQQQASLLFGG